MPISAFRSLLFFSAIVFTTGYASGCTAEASSGFLPSIMRRKPAHCSNALGPKRGTFLRALRDSKRPFSSR
ncbi:Uncharacterised protein [Vibrio cholerae]|nr:Uncharacterised protein [Vibrio cholerae]